MYGRYFLNRAQALVTLPVAAATLGVLAYWGFWVLALPYVLVRLREPATTMGGLLRPVRLLAHLTRDLLTFAILTAGSIRYRCVLL